MTKQYTFEELRAEVKLNREMKALIKEMQEAHEDMSEAYLDSLIERKKDLLSQHFKMHYGENVVPLIR